MSLNLGDVFVRFRVDTSGVREFQRSTQRLTRQTRQIRNSVTQAGESTSRFSDSLDRAARVAALTEGPLSGIASRLTTLRGLLNAGSLAAAGFTAALGTLVSTSLTVTKTFLATEDSVTKLGNAIQVSGRQGETSLAELDKAAERLARRTLLSLEDARQVFSQAAAFQNLPTDQLERFANVAADVGAAFGRDVKGSVTQFAKALEAPASALDGLGRVGVFFTKSQRQVLQSLVDTGNQAKATEIILGTLENRFKGFGDAKGAIGALDSLQVSIQLFRENIFRATGAGDALKNLFESLTRVFDRFNQAGGLAERTGKLLETVFNGLAKAIDIVSDNVNTIQRALEVFTAFVGAKFALALGAGTIATTSLTGALGVLSTVLKRFLPIAVIAGILELVDNLVKADESVGALKKTFLLLRAVFVVTIEELQRGFALLAENISAPEISINNLKIAFENLKTIGIDFVNTQVRAFLVFGKLVGVLLGTLVTRFKNFFNGIKKAGQGLFQILTGDIQAGLQTLKGSLFDGIAPGPEEVSKLKSEIQTAYNDALDFDITTAIPKLKEKIKSVLQNNEIFSAFKDFGDKIADELARSLVTGVEQGSVKAVETLSATNPPAQEMSKYLAELQTSLDANIDSFGKSISSSLGDAIVGKGEFDFRSLAQNFVSDLFSTLIQQVLIAPIVTDFKKIIGSVLGSGPGTSFGNAAAGASSSGLASTLFSGASSLFGGAFANGGIPPTNKLSVVGENGPEVFIPRQRGRIIPNDELGGMGGQTINMTVVTRDAESFRDSRNKIKSDLRGFVS